jgi:teichuronic acid exporter
LGYAAPILGSEVLAALRFNLDKVLVGSILGIEALGIYYFAFNAGYGLSMVLTNALAAASFPHLADHRLSPSELLARFDKALLGLALPITALIALQSLAVFFYVPVLFGDKWAGMTTIVAVLCLSAATKSWQDLGIQLLRAAGLTGCELGAAALFTVVLLGSLSIGLPFGLLAGVTSMSIAAIGLQLAFAAWARRLVARRYGLPAGPFSTTHGAAAPGAA